MGPVRYNILGNKKYATVEWTCKAPLVLKPFYSIAGVMSDSIITLGDTIIVSIRAVPISLIASPAIGSSGYKFEREPISTSIAVAEGIILIPVGFVIFYPMLLYEYSFSGFFYPTKNVVYL